MFTEKLVEFHPSADEALVSKARALDALSALPEGRAHVAAFLAAWTAGGWEAVSPWGHLYTKGAWGLFQAASSYAEGEV